MAVIKKSSTSYLLENISGQIGGLVFRQRNGKTVISRRPVRTNADVSPKSKAVRDKFTTANKFGAFLGKIPLIAAVWKTIQLQGYSTVTKIVKYNIKKVSEYWPTVLNTLTPDIYHIKIKEIMLNDDELSVIMDESYGPDPEDKLIVILCSFDPKNPTHDKFQLKDMTPAELKFKINLGLYEIPQYKSFIIFCVLIRQTGRGVHWSNTMALAVNSLI